MLQPKPACLESWYFPLCHCPQVASTKKPFRDICVGVGCVCVGGGGFEGWGASAGRVHFKVSSVYLRKYELIQAFYKIRTFSLCQIGNS